MSKTPKIIYTCRYRLGFNNPDNRYKSESYKTYLENDAKEMTDYYKEKKKEVVGMIDYYMGSKQERPVNLVLENGEYATKEEQEKIQNDFIKATEYSNLWKGVISFDNEWLTEKIKLRDLEKLLAQEILPKFFKRCGFKYNKNMRYCFSLHGNTKHLHFHLAFAEMKPNYVCKSGKITYRRKGLITEYEKNYLKEQLYIAIERDSIMKPMLTETNKDIDELKKYFNAKDRNFILKDINDIQIEEKIIKLGFLVDKYRNDNTIKKIKYGSIKDNEIGREIKSLVKEIKQNLFDNKNSELYKQRQAVKNDLKKLNDYYKKVNKDLHIESKVKNNWLVQRKEEYIDSYILNAIVNHSLYKTNVTENIVKSKKSKNRNEITLDDLLQELAFEKSKKYKNKNIKLILLKRNFKYNNKNDRFRLNSEITKAVKNINYEMEKEAKEFHKLFVKGEDEYENNYY